MGRPIVPLKKLKIKELSKRVLEAGTIRVKSQKAVLEHLTYREILEITGSEILAGEEGLEKEFNKFYIGAMTEKHVLDYVSEGGFDRGRPH